MFYLSDGMTFEVLRSLFLQVHFYIHRSFPQASLGNALGIAPLFYRHIERTVLASENFFLYNVLFPCSAILYVYYDSLFQVHNIINHS